MQEIEEHAGLKDLRIQHTRIMVIGGGGRYNSYIIIIISVAKQIDVYCNRLLTTLHIVTRPHDSYLNIPQKIVSSSGYRFCA